MTRREGTSCPLYGAGAGVPCSWSCYAVNEAQTRSCEACNAHDGEPCAWDCIELAQELEREELCEQSHARAVRAHADGLIGRAMTVEASKLYALVTFRAELDA